MSEQEIYEKFIAWLGKTWWGLPDSDQLMPIIQARYTVEEAEFLTGMPFRGSSLEELATAKGREPGELGPWLDNLAKKGIIFRSQRDDTVRYSLNDSYFVFLRSTFWPGDDDVAEPGSLQAFGGQRPAFAEPVGEFSPAHGIFEDGG